MIHTQYRGSIQCSTDTQRVWREAYDTILTSRIESISRLCWFDHEERKDVNDCMKHVTHFEVEGITPVGKLRKT